LYTNALMKNITSKASANIQVLIVHFVDYILYKKNRENAG